MFTLNKICLEAYLAKEMRQEQNSLEIFYTCLAGYDIMPEPFSTPLAHAPVLNSCNKFESNGGRSQAGISPGLLLEQINESNLPTTSSMNQSVLNDFVGIFYYLESLNFSTAHNGVSAC